MAKVPSDTGVILSIQIVCARVVKERGARAGAGGMSIARTISALLTSLAH